MGPWSGQTGLLLTGAGDTARARAKATVRRWWWLQQRDQPGVPSVRTWISRFRSPESRGMNACLSATQAVGLVPAAGADPQWAGHSPAGLPGSSCPVWTPAPTCHLDAGSPTPKPGWVRRVVQTMFHGERGAVSSRNRMGVLQHLQAPGAGKGRASAMTLMLRRRTGSPAALTDLNEAAGDSNADAQSLSERNFLQ